jgi:uncharacterized protein
MMRRLVLLGLVGLGAQFVDGSLGMAYGATSASLLLVLGFAPTAASSAIHLAEIGTTLVSGASHWRFGNVDWRVLARIAIPGGIGAFGGAMALSYVSAEAATPWVAGILLVLGIYVLSRFAIRPPRFLQHFNPPRHRFLIPLGVFAGFIDASGGGGWGPVATPALLVDGRMAPRKVIGTIDTSEFVVAVMASAGFLFALGSQGISWVVVGVLLAGGVVAAPLAAYLVRVVPSHILGSCVGGLIILTNVGTILDTLGVSAQGRITAYVVIGLLWLAAVLVSVRNGPGRTAAPEAAANGEATAYTFR